MKHHKDCGCERCGNNQAKPYPVSNYPIYENPSVIPINNPTVQPGKQNVAPLPSTIQEAFTSAAPREAFAALLRKQPELVHDVGFNGQQPLHKACLRGDPGLIEIFIHAGADLNARTNFNETPLHFACKRGNPRILHLLVEGGAELEAVDKSGKSAMHHAAQGGSVLALHYLSEVCGLDFNQRDYYFILPLHLAAAHGHKEAFSYLTRKGRSDIYERDGQENSCLHLAAQAGHEYLCWQVLETGRLAMIHEVNKQGFTPLQLARMGTNQKHRDICKWLSLHAQDKDHKSPIKGPVAGWWLHLFLPTIIYYLFLGFSGFFEQRGWTMLIGLSVSAFILYGHAHRMEHVSRWPNPIHAGMFASGFFSTMFCSYVYIFPYVYDDRPLIAVIAFIQTLLMLYMYYVLIRRDPGVIKESEIKEGLNEPYTIRDMATGLIRIESLCTDCEIIPPPRSHHCKICVKCYYDLDHHCLFLYNCVARHNHRTFILFIADVMISMVLFVYIAVLYLSKEYSKLDSNYDRAWQVFYEQPMIWTLMAMNTVSLVWGFILLKFQLGVVAKGHTTAYRPFSQSSLSYKQKLGNIIAFFKGRRPSHQDEVVHMNSLNNI